MKPSPLQAPLFVPEGRQAGLTEWGSAIPVSEPQEMGVSVTNTGVSHSTLRTSPAAALPVLPYGGEVPHVDRETSIEAAAVMEKKVGPLQAKVLLAIYQHGPLSDETLNRVCKAPPEKPMRPRRAELLAAGLVCDSGQKCLAASGLEVILWDLTPKGLAKAQVLKEEGEKA